MVVVEGYAGICSIKKYNYYQMLEECFKSFKVQQCYLRLLRELGQRQLQFSWIRENLLHPISTAFVEHVWMPIRFEYKVVQVIMSHHHHFKVHVLPKLIKGIWTAVSQQHKVDNQPLAT